MKVKLVVAMATVMAMSCGAVSWAGSPCCEGTVCSADVPAVNGETYTCPMHPEVTSDKPGKCPKCGMNLELKQPIVQAPAAAPQVRGSGVKARRAAIYTCSMHPEIYAEQPGKCPKCGMNLEKKVMKKTPAKAMKTK